MLGDVGDDRRRFIHRHRLGQQRLDVDLAFGDQAQAFRELADAVARTADGQFLLGEQRGRHRDVALRPADQRDVPGVGDVVHRTADRRPRAGALDDRLGHAPLGDRQDFGDGIAAHRIDGVRDAQTARQRQPFIDRIDDDRNGADHQRVLRRQQTDLPGAGDHHVLPGLHLGLLDRVHRNDQRLGHRHQMPGDAGRHLVQQVARMRNVFRHPALDMHAAHGQVLAAVGVADRAWIALAAIDVRLEDDAVAFLELRFVGADFHHLAGDFMSDDARVGDQRIDALVGANVRAADPGAAHLDQHLPVEALGRLDVADQDFPGFLEQYGFHDVFLSQKESAAVTG
jgi:hypothetical protein